MLRNLARRAPISAQNLIFPPHLSFSSLRPVSSLLGLSHNPLSCPQNAVLDLNAPISYSFSKLGTVQNRELLIDSRYPLASPSAFLLDSKGFATAASEIVSTDVEEEEEEEMQSLLEELSKEGENSEQIHLKKTNEMSKGKYRRLRRRQVKVETEAWEEAAKECREFLKDMCEHKLAPNLPYMKSLFLGWFETLRDEIAAEQERCKVNRRAAHGPYFDQLPADMMAVITMHKLMGLIMTGEGSRGVLVVQAACQIGAAIENEVGMILHFRVIFLW